MKKKTFEEVEAVFKLRDFTLVSKEYKGNKSPLDFICDQGHQTKICFDSLHNGRGCLECSRTKKKTIAEVEAAFNQKGFTLLSIEYKNNSSPLNYLCDKGHQTRIRFNNLMSGQGCLECSRTKNKTIEEVRELFTARNYTLLSTEYKGVHSSLNYICSNDHQSKISFANLQSGHGCPSCANHGFNPNKPAILYYLRFQFEGNFYYKIGITNSTTSKRFQSEKIPYTIIKETDFALGKSARDKEKAILKEFSAYRYKGKPFLDSGNTELFTKDILYIDSSVLVTC